MKKSKQINKDKYKFTEKKRGEIGEFMYRNYSQAGFWVFGKYTLSDSWKSSMGLIIVCSVYWWPSRSAGWKGWWFKR